MRQDDATDRTAPSGPDDFAARVEGIAALGEPVRRGLYRYVVSQAEPVNRDQAANALGVARHVAKFHLDRLVKDGLLDVEFSRPPGRRGPGAGRPSKFYRRSAREVAVSLPERRYDLAGRLLARAVTDAGRSAVPVGEALHNAARQAGRRLGQQAGQPRSGRRSRSARAEAVADVLEQCGYEPRVDESGVTLVNCPFHALAQEYTDLVCGMNLALMDGLVEELSGAHLQARLEPTPGRCCVRLRSASPGSGDRGAPKR